MSELKAFEELAERAQRPPAPTIDVAADVIRSLRRRRRPRPDPLWPTAAVMVAASIAVAIVAVQAWTSWQEPLAEMFGPLTMVMR